jgi:hypothetical protein
MKKEVEPITAISRDKKSIVKSDKTFAEILKKEIYKNEVQRKLPELPK